MSPADADTFEHEADARNCLTGYNWADGLRVIWTFLSPHDVAEAVDAEGNPTSKTAVWSLELEVPGQPMAHYRIIFSQEYVEARARAEAATRAHLAHAPLARGPW